MRPPLLFLLVFLLHLYLLYSPLHAYPQPSSSSNALLSFIPSSPANIHSLRKVLTLCCRDATLISHKRFTLHQVNILTLPSQQYQILQSLRSHISSLPHVRLIPPPLTRQQPAPTRPPVPSFYTTYHTLEDLQAKWAQLAQRYQFVTQSHIGESIEGRKITVLRIGTTNPDNPKRILINGLQHAREWISAAATTFIAEQLAANSEPHADGNDNQLRQMLRSVQVLIVPIVNPDGYVFSHIPENRLWRKNRREFSGECSPDNSDITLELHSDKGGVDLNRNWDKDFGGPLQTSKDHCHILYIGTKAFSEPETLAVSEFISATEGIKAHIDFHSFGQVILGPWASSRETPTRSCEYDIIGNEMQKVMFATSGSRYIYGRGPDFQNEAFAASGVMTDWVYHEFPETLSYTVELRPSNAFEGDSGFKLSEDQIFNTSREALSAVKTLLRYSNDPEVFLSQSSSFSQCRTVDAPPRIPEEGESNNVALIAGVSVGIALLVISLTICMVAFVIRKRRSKEKHVQQLNTSRNDEEAKDGAPLESVCAVVKVAQSPATAGSNQVRESSSNETLNTGPLQLDVLSTASNDCITPVCADESPSAWYGTEGASSYGNTVLLDAQNPYFPAQAPSAGQHESST